ncbi:mobile mystery protein B [Mesorhizobium escarrei]|uniref:Cell filamentation protein Fic n=1 Tax=Mesorhizobium escarrei TaxID=666018 RepID=A0ABN8JTC9_9HYPH|nr:mobile mystery protein B [Mesorhizobium escarrei]CAH2400870.1 Cell filamentation protein Fic [Mesorhizobium escarrei]
MSDLFAEPEDARPLEPEEREGLLQSWITHRGDLNEAEQENILAGVAWARGRRGRKLQDILSIDVAMTLHKRMFGDVWKWAGTCRTTARNIGVDAYRIQTDMAALFGDVRYWVENGTYSPDEIAVRLHHRLVAIHPFPNGNGRHARLMADLLIERLGGEPFSWGGGGLADTGELRTRYVGALRAADDHDIAPLLVFARS